MMKRRTFIKGISASGVLAYAAGNARASGPDWRYPTPAALADAVHADGQICVRIEFSAADSRSVDYETAVRVSGAHLTKIRPFFFSGNDTYRPDGHISGTSQPAASRYCGALAGPCLKRIRDFDQY
ncbi:MAG: hypothetical protein U5R06_02515 [candidate division KSB1 bacterium]|nr:hypothetical protein [candidate division KSB1 bacterium]